MSGLERHIALDSRLRAEMRRDGRVTHALGYGSFPQSKADRFSDLEYWLFLRPGEEASFDPRAWLESFGPVLHAVINEFGTFNATLPGLLRIELHAVSNMQLGVVSGWPGGEVFPERMVVKDQGGELLALLRALEDKQAAPREEAALLLDQALNWLVFGLNVLRRGERMRALELLGWIQGKVLRLAVLETGRIEGWVNPARLAETRLPPEVLFRYARLTAGLTPPGALESAYAEAVNWTLDLAARLGLPLSPALAAELRAWTQERA